MTMFAVVSSYSIDQRYIRDITGTMNVYYVPAGMNYSPGAAASPDSVCLSVGPVVNWRPVQVVQVKRT